MIPELKTRENFQTHILQAIADMAAVTTESGLTVEAMRIASDTMGAASVRIVTVRKLGARARYLEGEGQAPFEMGGRTIARMMREGQPQCLSADDARTAGFALPFATRKAMLVPCSKAGSDFALLLVWTEAFDDFPEEIIDGAVALAAFIGQVAQRIAVENESREQLANAERRARNLVAMVRSVGQRSARHAESMDEFLMHFEGRCAAIIRRHLPLSQSSRIDFELLLRDELLAEGINQNKQARFSGMQVYLDRSVAEGLGLALHELAVNSYKYGSLSGAGGHLELQWWIENVDDGSFFRLVWQERFPEPLVQEPDHKGFGLTMLEDALPFEMNARTEMDFAPRGLRVQISVPIEALNQTEPSESIVWKLTGS